MDQMHQMLGHHIRLTCPFLDYILWGYVKVVLSHHHHILWINLGLWSQMPFMKLLKWQLENGLHKLENRIERCIAKDGGHVET